MMMMLVVVVVVFAMVSFVGEHSGRFFTWRLRVGLDKQKTGAHQEPEQSSRR